MEEEIREVKEAAEAVRQSEKNLLSFLFELNRSQDPKNREFAQEVINPMQKKYDEINKTQYEEIKKL